MLQFALPDCAIDKAETIGTTLLVQAHTLAPTASCPLCQQSSSRIHSRYCRTARDLPVSHQAVRVRLRVRRFFCDNEACSQRTFVEPLADLLPPYAQRTSRFTQSLQAVAFALGGRPAARLAAQLRLPTSHMTCLRSIRTSSSPLHLTPRVLGVDDFALRKGRVYGTILVDLEQGKPIELLPDRSAETLANWLQQHPTITTIVRDRAAEYARGASQGAPHAQQIVDRWHLLVNAREALERLLARRHAYLCAMPASQELLAHLAYQRQQQPRPLRQASAHETVVRQERRARRIERYEQARALHAIGLPLTQIAQRLKMSWTTARDFAYGETFPERAPSKPRASQIDHYASYLAQRWEEGCTVANHLWREIVAQGYTGTRTQVERWVQHQRAQMLVTSLTAPDSDRNENEPTPAVATLRLASSRELVWVLLNDHQRLSAADRLLVAHLRDDPIVANAHDLVQGFQSIVRQRQADQFDGWLEACSAAQARELQNFATGIRREEAAIRAALCEPWSNGPVEGQITRLKSIKRQMYGRANFDLLRLRVLRAT